MFVFFYFLFLIFGEREGDVQSEVRKRWVNHLSSKVQYSCQHQDIPPDDESTPSIDIDGSNKNQESHNEDMNEVPPVHHIQHTEEEGGPPRRKGCHSDAFGGRTR
mmetsp:Transcript_11080/g.21633  ORF Transcript_11080/g.21633 Transcript_11080/m.21633 type:complete len:105 (+) Transcript_11080:283-597(+)